MKKKIEWINGNKMKFESEHKTYNDYVQIISDGNCVSPGFISMYVRSWNTLECGYNNKHEAGYFTKWDLNNSNLPGHIRESIRKYAESNPNESLQYCIFYIGETKWFMYHNGKKIIRMYTNNYKQESVCYEAAKYLIDDGK